MKSLPSLLVLLTCAVGASAQSPAILGKRNADFLKGLVKYGYLDLAQSLIKVAETANLPEAEKNAIAAAKLNLDMVLAQKEGDASKQKDTILKALRDKEALIAANPNSEESEDLRSDLANQYQMLAEAYAASIAQETDAAKQGELRKQGNEIFKAAIEALKARKDEVQKKRVEGKPETDKAYVVAFFNLGRTFYLQSLLWPADSFESKKAIENALNSLDEFDLEFGELLVAFEAKITVAMCHKQQGNMDTALGSLDDAISLRTRVDKKANGIYDLDEGAAEVVAKAVNQKLLFLKEQGAWDKILADGKDYLDTIPEPLASVPGKAILLAMADAHLQLGENEAAQTAATKLNELDPKGYFGGQAQRILATLISGASGGTKSSLEQILKLAESLGGGGETDQALRLCREVLVRAKGPDDQKHAANALLITGAIYASRQFWHEASVAFDAVYTRYPKTDAAPDGLWRSLNCYIEMKAADDLPDYKTRIDARSKQLQRDYPNDSHIPQLQLLEAMQLLKAAKFLEAAVLFDKVPADTSISLEARFRAADCYLRHGRRLEAAKQMEQAKPFLAKALDGYSKLLDEVTKSKAVTKDPKVIARLEVIDFSTRVALANNLLMSEPPKAADAEAMLAPIVIKEGMDASTVYALRTRALIAQNKVDDAVALLDNALQKSADAKSLAAAASTLAKALDARGIDYQKQKQVNRAAETWRKAAAYYIRSAESGSPEAGGMIADRLFAIGLMLNGIDANIESFFELPTETKITETDVWEQAVQLYGRLIETSSAATNYKIRIAQARTLGFLKRWTDADLAYAQLFADNKLIRGGKDIDSRVLAAKPELLTAYLDHGFTSMLAAKNTADKARRATASGIFEKLALGVPPNSKQWWFAKYGQIMTLFDRGLYSDADIAYRSLERTNPDLDGDRFKLKARFTALQQEIALKNPK